MWTAIDHAYLKLWKDDKKSLKLSETLFIPDLDTNLKSVLKLTRLFEGNSGFGPQRRLWTDEHQTSWRMLIDSFSRFRTVFFLKQKLEMTSCFKKFVRAVENRFEKKSKTLRSDQGGEFTSHDLKLFCESEGIYQQFRTAYTPQQNGVAERKRSKWLGV